MHTYAQFCIMAEQMSTGGGEEIVPPISQDMGRRAVDEPEKKDLKSFLVCFCEIVQKISTYYSVCDLCWVKRE